LHFILESAWSIEGGYADLGKTSYSGTITVGGVTGTANASTKLSASSLTAVRTWIVPNDIGNNTFSILAKFGIAQVKFSGDGSTTVPTSYSISGSHTKRGVTFGLGAKYDFDQNWSLRLDADSYDSGQDFYGRIPVYSAGLSYLF